MFNMIRPICVYYCCPLRCTLAIRFQARREVPMVSLHPPCDDPAQVRSDMQHPTSAPLLAHHSLGA